MSLSFTKQAVPSRDAPAPSLLSATLTAKPDGAVGGAEPAAGAVAPPVAPSSARGPEAFTVAEVVAAIVAAAATASPEAGLSSETEYGLLVAEDDGSVDPDFPEIDGSASITSVGVDKFVLVDRATDAPVLRVTIPSALMSLRRAEAAVVEELVVTCYYPPAVGHGAVARKFEVRVPGHAAGASAAGGGGL